MNNSCQVTMMPCQGILRRDFVAFVHKPHHSSSPVSPLLEQAPPRNHHDLEPVPIGSIGVEIVSELSVHNDPKILQAGNELIDPDVIHSFITAGSCIPLNPKQKKCQQRPQQDEGNTLLPSPSPSGMVGTVIEVPTNNHIPNDTLLGVRKRKLLLQELDCVLEDSPRENTILYSGAQDRGKRRHICGGHSDGPTVAPLSSDPASREPSTPSQFDDHEERNTWSDNSSSASISSSVVKPVPTFSTSNYKEEIGDASIFLVSNTNTKAKKKTWKSSKCHPPSSSATPSELNRPPRQSQTGKWYNRFQQLLQFKATYGHCCVPNSMCSTNPAFVQWVKRQRHQYKLKVEGKPSTLSDRRQQNLDEIGFVWDSHSAAWMERYNQLVEYQKDHGHCNVPTNWKPNRQLSVWVKSQRRQYKLYSSGSRSTITSERVAMMDRLEFDWNPRRLMM